jgi:hypothetical protein
MWPNMRTPLTSFPGESRGNVPPEKRILFEHQQSIGTSQLLGKGEAESSILSRSTNKIKILPNIGSRHTRSFEHIDRCC